MLNQISIDQQAYVLQFWHPGELAPNILSIHDIQHYRHGLSWAYSHHRGDVHVR